VLQRLNQRQAARRGPESVYAREGLFSPPLPAGTHQPQLFQQLPPPASVEQPSSRRWLTSRLSPPGADLVSAAVDLSAPSVAAAPVPMGSEVRGAAGAGKWERVAMMVRGEIFGAGVDAGGTLDGSLEAGPPATAPSHVGENCADRGGGGATGDNAAGATVGSISLVGQVPFWSAVSASLASARAMQRLVAAVDDSDSGAGGGDGRTEFLRVPRAIILAALRPCADVDFSLERVRRALTRPPGLSRLLTGVGAGTDWAALLGLAAAQPLFQQMPAEAMTAIMRYLCLFAAYEWGGGVP
jgi:hypothetical protein